MQLFTLRAMRPPSPVLPRPGVFLSLLVWLALVSGACSLASPGGAGTDELQAGLSEDLARLQAFLRPWDTEEAIRAGGKSFLQQQVKRRSSSLQAVAAPPDATASLSAMAGMMESMETEWKEKIGKANRAEKDEKTQFDATMKTLEPKAKAWDPKNGKNTYEMVEKYWKRQRANAHKQYHNLLKIAHAGIDRFRSTITAMHEAQAGKKLDAKTAKTLNLGNGEEPEVVFLAIGQHVRSLGTWVRQAARELASFRTSGPLSTPEAASSTSAPPGSNNTTVAAMEARLRQVAAGMRRNSDASARKATDSTSAGFRAMAKIADEAEASLKEVSKAQGEAEKRRLLEAALGPRGMGAWMASLTASLVATDQEAEEQESELLLSLLMRRAKAWPLAKHLEVLASFAEKGNYPALATLMWSLDQKPVANLEVPTISAHLAELMDARHKAPPADTERETEHQALGRFKLRRKLTGVLKNVKMLAKAAPDDHARQTLGVAKIEAMLEHVLAEKNTDPEEMAAALMGAKAWAANLKASDVVGDRAKQAAKNASAVGTANVKKVAERLALVQLEDSFSASSLPELLSLRAAVQLLTGEN